MRRPLFILWSVFAASCGGTGPAVRFEVADRAEEPAIRRMVSEQSRRVTGFFGMRFPGAFAVVVLPDRRSFDAHLRTAWREPQFASECWMVGVGMAGELILLSPARWRAEACEHDPGDEAATARLIGHELVHVFHSQVNARLETDPAAFEPMGWFVEGLAVHVSGQLADGHLASAEEALAQGKGPAALASAWTGKYRYGVSGSLVAFVDRTFGRPAMRRMLAAGSQTELLAVLGVGEEELLARWRASLSPPIPR